MKSAITQHAQTVTATNAVELPKTQTDPNHLQPLISVTHVAKQRFEQLNLNEAPVANLTANSPQTKELPQDQNPPPAVVVVVCEEEQDDNQYIQNQRMILKDAQGNVFEERGGSPRRTRKSISDRRLRVVHCDSPRPSQKRMPSVSQSFLLNLAGVSLRPLHLAEFNGSNPKSN